jgi:hypothetical protein
VSDVTNDDVTENDVNDATVFGSEAGDESHAEVTPAAPAQTGAAASDTVDSLITEEEYAQHASNPTELRKLIKTRHDEALAKHADVIEFKRAYDADPVATVTNLARRLGVLKDNPAPATPQTPQPSFEQATYARLSKVLGPQLAGEMTAVLIETAKAMSEQATAPIRQTLQQTSQAAAQAEATQIVSSYFEKNPDAVPHQETMFKLMNKFAPGPEMSDHEWLDLLYEKAAKLNAPAQVTDGRKVAANLIRSTVQQIRGASPAQITTKVPSATGKRSDIRRAAFEAAARGERWDG